MPGPFEIADLGDRCFALNRDGRTVATITSQGCVDWLLRGPSQEGELIQRLAKETHLSYVLGFKFLLTTPTPSTELTSFRWEIVDDGQAVILIGDGESADGNWKSHVTAAVAQDLDSGEYVWQLDTSLTCQAHDPVELKWLEFNNVYPALTGCCFLYAPQKRYHHTLMQDRNGVVWDFPHQHLLHYTRKINQLEFANGTWAGFFGEQDGSPVVEIERSSLPPDWAICDMYYDLHCGARPQAPIEPGSQLYFRYRIHYLSPIQSRQRLAKAHPVEITSLDWKTHDYPRLELGMNHFDAPVMLDRFDDASGFRQSPPSKVWDRNAGSRDRGALRLTNEAPVELVWSAEPPTQIPPNTVLVLSAMVRTEGCTDRGIFLRVRYHTFVWHPQPHVVWWDPIESKAVNGTSRGWMRIETPELRVPEDHLDYLVWIDVVLDGPGVAWLTDVDVQLVHVDAVVPVWE